MILIEDSREQTPLKFNKSYIDYVMSAKLDYGDYSAIINDSPCPVYFERKSIGDLFGTLSRKKGKTGESRADIFKKEIGRCVADGNKLVLIIECSLTDILKGYSHSDIKGLSIVRTLFTFMLRYHVPFVCCSSRREMANYISEFYYALERNTK